ncbi:heavy metal translocating P-type ATPase [uncultured Desulfobacter sp.]|uniref:heavy metal translocating P-type ATPase n=1 Tax=uncultured Desulfobacter sp. TaxID=240139 RepID=UPI002AAB4923|nr:heavy metal translocating P-type ATPase [uncultured Desulfobacter sp.]
MTVCTHRPFTIVSELPNRVRLKGRFLRDPNMDPDYLEATLETIPGVQTARLNGRASSVIIRYDGRDETRGAVLGCIQDLPLDIFKGKNDRKSPPSLLNLSVKGIISLACFFLPALFAAPLALMLSAPVILDGIICLWNRKLKVEVLDAAAVSFSLWRRDYFTATTIVALLALGEYFEKISETKTTGLLKSLLKPQTDKIWIEKDGQEIQIPFAEAGIGDRVVCGPGEMIPLDGRVVDGDASINQSSVTGESVPVHVKPGDEVISGSVIEEGRIIFEAVHVGAETAVARISKFLEDSLRYESDSQKKSDELADKLVPLTFGLGVGLFAMTRNLEKAAAVLTVDYSCVIKLSSPVAVRVAMHTAARQGVLLKGAQAVDSLARLDTLVFDKTGTLTRGELQVTDIFSAQGLDDDQLLVLAASAEEHYAHPVAAAVLDAARDRGLTLSPTSQVDFIVAHGVSAYIDDLNVLVGSRHFIEDDEGIDCSSADKAARAFQKEGKSLLYVARDGKLEGVLGLRDELRPEAPAVLAGLKAAGIKKIVILTGDTERTANALAASLPDVDEVYAELRPGDKADIVARLKDEGCILGFTGDGVNDAPALVSAHVGICLPSGADLAKESAQVILLKEDLNSLLTARQIALRCQGTIKQAFVSAVSLNSSFLLLASLGWLRPVAAAILHNVSTLGIIGYAGMREKQLIHPAPDMPEKKSRPYKIIGGNIASSS